MVSMVQVVFQLAVADVVVIMPIIFVTDEPMPVIKLVSMVVTLIPMAPNPAQEKITMTDSLVSRVPVVQHVVRSVPVFEGKIRHYLETQVCFSHVVSNYHVDYATVEVLFHVKQTHAITQVHLKKHEEVVSVQVVDNFPAVLIVVSRVGNGEISNVGVLVVTEEPVYFKSFVSWRLDDLVYDYGHVAVFEQAHLAMIVVSNVSRVDKAATHDLIVVLVVHQITIQTVEDNSVTFIVATTQVDYNFDEVVADVDSVRHFVENRVV